MNSATQIFVATWVNNFLGQAGIIGSWEPADFSLGSLKWLDKRESLNDLQVALVAMRSDHKARKGHLLAGEILNEIDTVLNAEPKRIFFRRPNRKSKEYAYAAA